MQKILNFLKQAVGAIGSKIFRKKAEEEKKEKVINWVILGVVGVVVVVLAGWLIASKIWPQPSPKLPATNPIAEAKITVVTSRACGKECWNPQLFVDALTQQGIKIADKETVYADSWWPFSKSKSIIKQFQIAKVPTLIVEFTGANQPDINTFFSATLGNVIDGKFILTKILAPYYNLAEKKLKGLIKVTYLTDNSCAECYDIAKHETALKNLGASTDNSETIDISSPAGQELVNKYKITRVPTLLVSGEVDEYTILTQAWTEVGAIAEDGTYIFTNLDLMGDSYRDLTTGKIIKTQEPVTQ